MEHLLKSIIDWLRKILNFSSIQNRINTSNNGKSLDVNDQTEGDEPSSALHQEKIPEVDSGVADLVDQTTYTTTKAETDKSEPPSSVIQNESEKPDIAKNRKPYKKKSPTDETQINRRYARTLKPKEKEAIFLGVTSRARQKKLLTTSKTENGEKHKENDVEVSVKEKVFRIQAPYFEISLDEGKVYLIFPEQTQEVNSASLTEQVIYAAEINGEEKNISSRVRIHNDGKYSIDETKMVLDEPLSDFKVIFPEILQQREYNYTHYDKSLYVFVAVGNDCGRMFYLFDPSKGINPLPKRNLWILIEDGFELDAEPILIEDKWIWENYQPYLVDSSEIATLEIKEISQGQKKNYGLEKSFQLEGETLAQDDFKKESPLFSGTTVKIRCPYVYDGGWRVWISEKHGNSKLVSDNWTGEASLELKCPEDLPCNYGEFQIDICPPGSRISDDTLFFRWIPTIKLNYDRQLTLPNRNSGHEPAKISLRFDDCSRWKVVDEENYPVKLVENVYLVTLPAEKDSVRLHISKHDQLDLIVTIQISLPRVRWRIAGTGTWLCTPIRISPKALQYGKQIDLIIKTNDIYGNYVFEGILKSREEQLQMRNFKRNGMEYVLPLNQFFDTIKSHSGGTTLTIKILTADKQQFLGMIEPIVFEPENMPTIYGNLPKAEEVKRQIVEKIKPKVLCSGGFTKRRQGKGFSKKELNADGLSLSETHRLNIPFDRRRKSCHNWNVEKLLSFKNEANEFWR
jgi:ribosomal protein L13E